MAWTRALAPAACIVIGLSAASASSEGGVRLDPRLETLLGEAGEALASPSPGAGAAGHDPGSFARLWPPPRAQGAELACLTEALYHEARGEGVRGMRAVAEVVLNRVESPRFPETICAVVRQGAQGGAACQFSYACDGSLRQAADPRTRARAERIAREMAAGAPRRLTDGATHFHTTAVAPDWAAAYVLTATIGVHRFYRPPDQVAAN
jgi:spore germination cell wall hydrolase CwlJ-like protein